MNKNKLYRRSSTIKKNIKRWSVNLKAKLKSYIRGRKYKEMLCNVMVMWVSLMVIT